MLQKLKRAFNKLPSPVQVAIYVGSSASAAVVISNLEAGQPLDTRAALVPLLTIIVNVLAYLIARED